MKIFKFDHEPSFAELWDACVYNLLYNTENYKKDIEELFERLGISKQSKIIDTSAGGGFPAIELSKEGYEIVSTDGFDDEVELFNRKAKEHGVNTQCKKVFWKDLPGLLSNNSFNFLFCRGNSFIYADGGWNAMVEIDVAKAMENYESTMKVFYDLLKPGGWMYVDKFKDDETTHREKVGEIQVNGSPIEDLVFWTQRFPEKKIRQASMIRKAGDNENSVPNITYDLSGAELEKCMSKVGFKNIQKVSLPSEQHFDVWMAQK
jgi:ubiquinone/menaquinone biosynthesis C-methylase UbiE